MMFPNNLNSSKEDEAKRKYEETQREIEGHSRSGLSSYIVDLLIAGGLVVAVLTVLMWILYL
ncbi:hypothetical protein P4H27_01255 [Paenibacillus taichungensis]|jgi:uncharacterized membrane protein|nr:MULTISPECIES: hypothetical protein [Paenibacillus]MEC0105563.1 hypothetical protein [Paenibacillus taichungensis]PIH56243.1 hypothetical protein CS562_27255 [Paenibacillus sp. LK1]